MTIENIETTETTTDSTLPVNHSFESALEHPRPHRVEDDSNVVIDGARQLSITQLCSFSTMKWAKEFLCMRADHPGHTLLMVRDRKFLLETLTIKIFQLQYATMMLIERFVPVESPEYEMCRIQVTNTTSRQLRHQLASFCSEIKIISENLIPKYRSYISNGGFLWSLVGK